MSEKADDLKQALGIPDGVDTRIRNDGVIEISDGLFFASSDTKLDKDGQIYRRDTSIQSVFTGEWVRDDGFRLNAGRLERRTVDGWAETNTRINNKSGVVQVRDGSFSLVEDDRWSDTPLRLNPVTREFERRDSDSVLGGYQPLSFGRPRKSDSPPVVQPPEEPERQPESLLHAANLRVDESYKFESAGCFDSLISAAIFAVLALIAFGVVASSVFIWGGMIVVSTLVTYAWMHPNRPDKKFDYKGVETITDCRRSSARNLAIAYGFVYAAIVIMQGPERQWTYFKVTEWSLYCLIGVGIGFYALGKTSQWSERVVTKRLAKHPAPPIKSWLRALIEDFSGHVVAGTGALFGVTICYLFWLASETQAGVHELNNRQTSQTTLAQAHTTTTDATGLHHVLPDFSGLKPIISHTYNHNTGLKRIDFKPTVSARYVAWECLSEQNGKQFSSAAEVNFLDNLGKQIPSAGIKVIYADSQEIRAESAAATNVLDGNPKTIWHSSYSSGVTPLPHVLIFDLGRVYQLKALQYLPRQDRANGRVKDCRIYAQVQPFTLP